MNHYNNNNNTKPFWTGFLIMTASWKSTSENQWDKIEPLDCTFSSANEFTFCDPLSC